MGSNRTGCTAQEGYYAAAYTGGCGTDLSGFWKQCTASIWYPCEKKLWGADPSDKVQTMTDYRFAIAQAGDYEILNQGTLSVSIEDFTFTEPIPKKTIRNSLTMLK